MNDKDLKTINKIIEHSNAIIIEVKGIKNADDFQQNSTISKAVLFDLLQIGELSNKLSVEYVTKSSLPWNNIYNLRNRIVHGYAGVDYQIIWDTIKKDIPKLNNELKKEK